jgi:hypothetical protein
MGQSFVVMHQVDPVRASPATITRYHQFMRAHAWSRDCKIVGQAPNRMPSRWSIIARTTLAILTLTFVSRAEPGHHDLGAGLALGYGEAREDQFARLRLAGPAGRVELTHRHFRSTFEVESRLHQGVVPYFDRPGTVNATLSYGVDTRIRFTLRQNARSLVRLGPMLDLHAQNAILGSRDAAHLYWLGVLALGPSAQLLHGISICREVAVDVELPLIALVSRPAEHRPYGAEDPIGVGTMVSRPFDSPHWTTVNRYQALRVRSSYRGKYHGWRWDPFVLFEIESNLLPRWVASVKYLVGFDVHYATS